MYTRCFSSPFYIQTFIILFLSLPFHLKYFPLYGNLFLFYLSLKKSFLLSYFLAHRHFSSTHTTTRIPPPIIQVFLLHHKCIPYPLIQVFILHHTCIPPPLILVFLFTSHMYSFLLLSHMNPSTHHTCIPPPLRLVFLFTSHMYSSSSYISICLHVTHVFLLLLY
jgi:hypothetical protein